MGCRCRQGCRRGCRRGEGGGSRVVLRCPFASATGVGPSARTEARRRGRGLRGTRARWPRQGRDRSWPAPGTGPPPSPDTTSPSSPAAPATSRGRRNAGPQTGWLQTAEVYSLTGLEARRPRPRPREVWFLLRVRGGISPRRRPRVLVAPGRPRGSLGCGRLADRCLCAHVTPPVSHVAPLCVVSVPQPPSCRWDPSLA